ncbi:MAG: FAD-dependent oxidoreductase [Butyricimonas faecihominis]
MNRKDMLNKLQNPEKVWDMVVVGGGATGLGVAVDAATRGYSVVLLEMADFAKSTSSRSTKLVHGGVRYLQKGDVALVLEALRERGRMKANAPHLVKDQAFVISNYTYWDNFLYFCGLTFMTCYLCFGYGKVVLFPQEGDGAFTDIGEKGLKEVLFIMTGSLMIRDGN